MRGPVGKCLNCIATSGRCEGLPNALQVRDSLEAGCRAGQAALPQSTYKALALPGTETLF